MWRTAFDPDHIAPPEATLTGLRDNPADPHTEKYELAMIDLFQHFSDELTGEDGEQGFDIKFSTSRRCGDIQGDRETRRQAFVNFNFEVLPLVTNFLCQSCKVSACPAGSGTIPKKVNKTLSQGLTVTLYYKCSI